MSGIALFAPDEETYFQATQLLSARPNRHIRLVKHIQTSEAILEARSALEAGANIIIARGKQAHFIRQNTNIPVVEIQLSAQELGLLILKAKKLLGREHIRIGLFGWGNMFGNTAHFDELFNVELHTYILEHENDWQKYLLAAQNDGCEVMIGGRSALQYESLLNIPHIYLSGTEESLVTALNTADKLYQMSENEQRNQAQFSAVLYSATNGILKISSAGSILLANRTIEDMLGRNAGQLVGLPLSSVMSGLDFKKIDDVLSGKSENYSGFTTLRSQRLLIVAEPIVVAGQIDGAILSCTNLVQLNSAENNTMKEQLLKGSVALANFEMLSQLFPDLSPMIERAKIFALSPSPMLIEATSGPELEMFAQSIHNQSIRKSAPFVIISLSGLTEEQQELVLFGNPKVGVRGALVDANHGTLVIQGIDKLTLPLQYQLVRVIRTKKLRSGASLSELKLTDVRIIATTGKNLSKLREQYLFRSDLLFMLKALRLRIPPLKERQQDISLMLDTMMRDYSRQYSSWHSLSDGARKAILSYPWEGNMIQLQSFCERMILTVQKRTISESYVRELLHELYEQDSAVFESIETPISVAEQSAHADIYSEQDPIRELICNTLHKYRGNRRKTAEALHMSTTTLWRKMKQYQIPLN